MGVRSPSDSTDGDIQTFIVIYVTTGSNFTDFDHIIVCVIYQVLYVQVCYVQVLYVQIEHQG